MSKLFLAVPLYGGQMLEGFHKSVCHLMKECAKEKIFLGIKYVVNDSLVPRARNRLAFHFLNSDCTDLLFVDADISFEAKDALSLMERPEPVIGGIYSRKQVDWGRISKAAKNGIKPYDLPPFGTVPVLNWAGPVDNVVISEPLEVRHVGTGFMRIKREVFTTMIEKYGDEIMFDYAGDEPTFKGVSGFDFFPAGIDKRFEVGTGKRQYLSEDWFFCERARECGYKIYAAPWVRLVHTGPYDYIGDLAALDEPTLENKI